MSLTKYGKYITREIIKESKYSQITDTDGELQWMSGRWKRSSKLRMELYYQTVHHGYGTGSG